MTEVTPTDSEIIAGLRQDNESLENEISLLRELLKNQKKEERCHLCSAKIEQQQEVSVQTDDDMKKELAMENGRDDWNGTTDTNEENSQISVSDMVRSVAEQTYTEHVLPGFVLHAESGMYYNYESGYYYDPTYQLFYHPTTAHYYYYDQNTNEYKIWEKPETSSANSQKFSSTKYRRLASRYNFHPTDNHQVFEVVMDLLDSVEVAFGCRRPKRTYAQLLKTDDDLEFLEEVIDLTGPEGESDSTSSDSSDYDMDDLADEARDILLRRKKEKEANQFAPCIRLMEMPQHTLHIVTITGASIGRASDSTVLINDEDTVSRKHANIVYCEKKKRYFIDDLGSRHGTFLNDNPVNDRKRLKHLDRVKVGAKLLMVHLHSGNNTCTNCEPGLVAINHTSEIHNDTLPTVGKDKQRRQELKNLKKQYGLEGSNFTEPPLKTKYTDRADHRRRTAGSVHDSYQRLTPPLIPHQGPMPLSGPVKEPVSVAASVNRAITSENKGFKMLEKMGWTEGSSLGKSKQGIKEPIAPSMQIGTAGLGATSEAKVMASLSSSGKAKAQRLLTTQKRYLKAQLLFDEDIQELKTFQKPGDTRP